MHASAFRLSSHPSIAAIALSLAAVSLACDPYEDHDREFDEEALLLDSGGESEADPEPPQVAQLVLTPPQTAQEAGKDVPRPQALDADVGPTASLGWLAGVSEETPPATCAGGGAVTGVDCLGWSCDIVQMWCDTHSGTAGARTWTDWFSEEATSSRICPGTQWLTGVACDGPWCDRMSLECTELGITTTSCSWTRFFDASDPTFYARPDELIGGIQCQGAYCAELSFLTCEV